MNWPLTYLSPSGRIDRKRFAISLSTILALASLVAISPMGHVAALMATWPTLCIFAKRLRDVGVSPMWGLLCTASWVASALLVPASTHGADAPMLRTLTWLVTITWTLPFSLWISFEAGKRAPDNPPALHSRGT